MILLTRDVSRIRRKSIVEKNISYKFALKIRICIFATPKYYIQ